MTKHELIQKLQKKCNLTGQGASEAVEIFFNEMIKAFVNGERVEIRGLCSFYIKDYKPYTGRNPKTGESVQISAKKLPFFKCGKGLKERVDYPVN